MINKIGILTTFATLILSFSTTSIAHHQESRGAEQIEVRLEVYDYTNPAKRLDFSNHWNYMDIYARAEDGSIYPAERDQDLVILPRAGVYSFEGAGYVCFISSTPIEVTEASKTVKLVAECE